MRHIAKFHWITVCLLISAGAASAAPFTLWPMPPRPPGISDAEYPVFREYNYFRNFQDQIDKARAHPPGLLIDGDNLMLYWPQVDPETWRARYARLNAVDFGSGHDRVENLLWRLNHGELDGLHPALIVLQIGNNNVFTGTPPEEIAASIKLAVDTVRRRSPGSHVLLLGVFPCGASPADPLRSRVTRINQLIAKLDDGRDVTYLDTGAGLLQPDRTLAPGLAPRPDFEVITQKGYELLADAIQPVIDRYCSKPAAPAPAPVASNEPMLSWPLPSPPPGISPESYPTPPLDWIEVFSSNLDKLKQGPYDLLFDGDSITDNWQNPGKEVWSRRYGAFKAVDMGIGGDQVQNVLWRVRNGELAGQNPKLIVLLIGTNNHGQDPNGVAAGIKLILHEYETRCPRAHILLLGIFAVGPNAQVPERAWSAQVNRILATYDDGNRVTYMDIRSKFLHPDGTLTPDIMPDYLHPSAKGYEIWADAIQPVVNRYMGKPLPK